MAENEKTTAEENSLTVSDEAQNKSIEGIQEENPVPVDEFSPSSEPINSDQKNDEGEKEEIHQKTVESPDFPPEENNSQNEHNVSEMLDSVSERVESLLDGVAKLEGNMVSLQKTVAGFYTQTTDSMHREIEKYRKGLIRKLEQELFGELIELYDTVDSAIEKATKDPSIALSLIEGFKDQLDAALFNRGIEKREAVIGEKFDPRRHHVTRPDVPTGDKALDGTVAAISKAGFDDMDESFKELREGCMKLRPVWVRLYRYDESLVSPSVVAEPMQNEEISNEKLDK